MKAPLSYKAKQMFNNINASTAIRKARKEGKLEGATVLLKGKAYTIGSRIPRDKSSQSNNN